MQNLFAGTFTFFWSKYQFLGKKTYNFKITINKTRRVPNKGIPDHETTNEAKD